MLTLLLLSAPTLSMRRQEPVPGSLASMGGLALVDMLSQICARQRWCSNIAAQDPALAQTLREDAAKDSHFLHAATQAVEHDGPVARFDVAQCRAELAASELGEIRAGMKTIHGQRPTPQEAMQWVSVFNNQDCVHVSSSNFSCNGDRFPLPHSLQIKGWRTASLGFSGQTLFYKPGRKIYHGPAGAGSW